MTVEGPIEIADTDRETRLDIATRYLGEEMGTGYVNNGPAGDDIVVRLRPTRWRTTDYSKLDLGG